MLRAGWLRFVHPHRGNWSPEEEFLLAQCHALVGSHWSKMTKRLPGRTENSIKNFWNATLRSKCVSAWAHGHAYSHERAGNDLHAVGNARSPCALSCDADLTFYLILMRYTHTCPTHYSQGTKQEARHALDIHAAA